MPALDMPAYAAMAVLGLALIAIARWAGRRRGTRWDSLVALRSGDVLLTEVVGAFIVGYAVGAIIAPPGRAAAGPPVPPGRFGGVGSLRSLPVFLGIVGALVSILTRIDVRDLLLGGRAARNPVRSYIGWNARVIAAIPAGGFGEILMRDGIGNVMSIAATADMELPVGTEVRVVATRDLNIVVAPLAG